MNREILDQSFARWVAKTGSKQAACMMTVAEVLLWMVDSDKLSEQICRGILWSMMEEDPDELKPDELS